MSQGDSFKISRRRLLCMFGLGAVGVIVATDSLFAKQFARETTPMKLPDMVYDVNLQMMVDPASREPLYVRSEMLIAQAEVNKEDKKVDKKKSKSKAAKSKAAKSKVKPLPTITAGCDKCPKCDDNCG